MNYVSDLHLHSKYSRAVSPQMTLPVMAQYALQKGLDILTASDWTHPLWFKEISQQLEEAGEGMYALRAQMANSKWQMDKKILFLLSTEISSIYKQGDKLRRIHNLVFVPSLEAAEKVSKELVKRGCNLNADGRPIIGLWSKNLLELILGIDDRSMLIPCHIWTPHFGIYGSASGFDSLEEAFGELASQVYGIETGLSSDPDMNWQTKELMNRSILSFSDAHSPAKMGREATVFVSKNGISNNPISNKPINTKEKISYEDVRQAIMRKENSRLKIGYTIEFYPEEGKYHYSGHRNCKVVLGPEEIREKGTTCPVCRKKLTEGVFMRVEQLSDQKLFGRVIEKKNEQGLKWHTDKMKIQPPYVKLVPLLEIVAEGMGSTVASQKVQSMFTKLCSEVGSELEVLLHAPIKDIEKASTPRIAEGISKVREGDISIDPGYDGEFGKVKIWDAPGGASLRQEENKSQLSFDL